VAAGRPAGGRERRVGRWGGLGQLRRKRSNRQSGALHPSGYRSRRTNASTRRPTDETRAFTLDHTENLDSHYSDGNQFDSDVERTLAQKWERSNTEWELVREDDVFDLGAEVMIPDFAIEHPDGRRAILEIVGFWTPEYLESKLTKIRQVEADNFVLAVSERLDCASEEFGRTADRVLWFKTGIHVYDVVDLAETVTVPSETPSGSE